MDTPIALRVEVDRWNSARELLSRLRRYVFRGHASSSWNLATSLEREAQRLNATDWITVAEAEMLRSFQRRAHHHLTILPDLTDTLGWLALIQHYGGPTRLLDFTRSPYIAAFFAMEHASDEAAVWAISKDALLQHNARILGTGPVDGHLVADARCLDLANQALVSKAEASGVVLVEPFRLDDRISKQQGCFLVPLSLEYSFQENLEANFGIGCLSFDAPSTYMYNGGNSYFFAEPPPILQVILPRRLHPDAMLDLEAMNVNSASLFAGLDGFARSLPGTLRNLERRYFEREDTRRLFDRNLTQP